MVEYPKICAACPSYNRPDLLGQAIAMFQAQDYPNKEMVILEDSGVWGDGEEVVSRGWKLVSCGKRYKSVGAKRNAIAQMTDAKYIQVWDDDDYYLPWMLSASVHALRDKVWAQPRQALEFDSPGVLGRYHCLGLIVRRKLRHNRPLVPHNALDWCYGAGWSYRRAEFLASGGYPENIGNGDDTEWAQRMLPKYGVSADTICDEFPRPAYIYSRWMSGSWHASELGRGVKPLESLADMPRKDRSDLVIRLPEWYYDIEIPDKAKPRKW